MYLTLETQKPWEIILYLERFYFINYIKAVYFIRFTYFK